MPKTTRDRGSPQTRARLKRDSVSRSRRRGSKSENGARSTRNTTRGPEAQKNAPEPYGGVYTPFVLCSRADRLHRSCRGSFVSEYHRRRSSRGVEKRPSKSRVAPGHGGCQRRTQTPKHRPPRSTSLARKHTSTWRASTHVRRARREDAERVVRTRRRGWSTS
ncbi:uncharacterized protein LOC119770225 [Culex quinquefasciatus]|uniref:uncharacterized protein LOC119770225 n=1 Tax=Culex quinquefasciatus TaxID=7176 RepID=UPI0018E2E3E9|nr:uncharacterized protein LOC119770225 [Culex quinquefasciatus]